MKAAIHGILLGRGAQEFRTPASLAVLAATLAVSLAQAALSVRALRPAAPRAPP